MTSKELAKMLTRETLKIDTAAKIRAILDAASKEYDKISGEGAWGDEGVEGDILSLVGDPAEEFGVPADG